MEPSKLRLYQVTNHFASEIAPHISSALRDLVVILEKYLLSIGTKLVDADPEGNLESWYGTQIKQKNTQNNLIEGEIITIST